MKINPAKCYSPAPQNLGAFVISVKMQVFLAPCRKMSNLRQKKAQNGPNIGLRYANFVTRSMFLVKPYTPLSGVPGGSYRESSSKRGRMFTKQAKKTLIYVKTKQRKLSCCNQYVPLPRCTYIIKSNQNQTNTRNKTKIKNEYPKNTSKQGTKLTSDDGKTKPLRLHSPTSSSIEHPTSPLPCCASAPPPASTAFPEGEAVEATIRAAAVTLRRAGRCRRNSDEAFRERGLEREAPLSAVRAGSEKMVLRWARG